MKIIILLCLLSLSFMMICEKNEAEGELLMRLGNLSHRGLGILYWNTVLEPQRNDFLKTYIIQYKIASDGELFQEGMKRPVIDMLTVSAARWFPRDIELQMMQKIVMWNHYKKLEEAKTTSLHPQ